MILLLILVFIVIILLEVPSLIMKKQWRELVVFTVLLFLAFILALLQTMGFKLPSPSSGIDFIIKDLLHLNYE